MGIVVKANEGVTRQLPPADNHVARCIKLVHIGSIYDEKYDKLRNQVMITWELPNELAKFKDVEEPFVVSKTYTLSLSEKATLRKDIENWRGQKFTEKELEGFDLVKLLGQPCMVQVVHSDDGKYANVSGVSKIPKGLPVPAQINKSIYFSISEFTEESFNKLHDWEKKKVEASNEYQVIIKGASDSENVADQESDDDLPF
jgi:hypothetical protein